VVDRAEPKPKRVQSIRRPWYNPLNARVFTENRRSIRGRAARDARRRFDLLRRLFLIEDADAWAPRLRSGVRLASDAQERCRGLVVVVADSPTYRRPDGVIVTSIAALGP